MTHEKTLEKKKQYRIANKEKIVQARKKYYLKNKNILKQKQRKRYLADPEKFSKRNKDWHNRHRDKILEIRNNYYKNNKTRLLASKRLIEGKFYAGWMAKIKLTGRDKCSHCGYDKCFAAIDFHHLDPSQKEMGIGRILKLKLTDEKWKEMEKTIPLCANCHREIHYEKRMV